MNIILNIYDKISDYILNYFKEISWVLVFLLSTFGALVGLGTVLGMKIENEIFLWCLIFVVYTLIIAKNAPSAFFKHIYITFIVDAIWISTLHIAYFSRYAWNNPFRTQMNFEYTQYIPSRVMEVIIQVVFCSILGSISGLITLYARRFIKHEPIETK